MRIKKFLLSAVVLILSASQLTLAQSLQEFEKKVTEFTLDNGLTVLVIERHDAPVASFATYVDVGSANEPIGKSGIAHIFEHMAFKGSTYIGTTDAQKELKVLEKVDDTYQAWLNAKYAANPDTSEVARLWKEFKSLEEESKSYVKNNEFSEIVDRAGGVGMNATTSSDATRYFYSLPSNKAELWFNLESERFLDPVFREFYVEKDVVKEERRMRTDSSPIGRLIEEFLSVAYTAHPYGISTIGWPSDIESTTIEDARRFYETYYVPSNMVVAVSGDVNPKQIKKLAETYFGRLPKGSPAPELMIKEPKQRGERRFVIREQSQPWFLAGYHTVSNKHEDANALELLGSILSGGRTSRLYKRMVEEEASALSVGALNGFPGDKYESMFLTFVIPNQGVELEKVEATLDEEIAKVKNGEISEDELERVKTQARANLIRNLDSNMGLALQLSQAKAQHGDWRKVFTGLDDLEAVTLEDIQRVANTYLIESNRTVGMIVNEAPKTASAQ